MLYFKLTSRKGRKNVSRETSSDRGKDKKLVPTQKRAKVDDKDRMIDDEQERSKPKINYKEDDTTESGDLMSDSSEDSFGGKGKLKSGEKKKVKRPGVIKDVDLIEELETLTEEVLKVSFSGSVTNQSSIDFFLS